MYAYYPHLEKLVLFKILTWVDFQVQGQVGVTPICGSGISAIEFSAPLHLDDFIQRRRKIAELDKDRRS